MGERTPLQSLMLKHQHQFSRPSIEREGADHLRSALGDSETLIYEAARKTRTTPDLRESRQTLAWATRLPASPVLRSHS
jgi:hypothetical protein